MRTGLVLATLFLAFGGIESRMSLVQLRNAVKGMKNICTAKTGVSAEILQGASNGIIPPDPALQCYYKCLLEMMKVMKNDVLLVDTMVKKLQQMAALDILDRIVEVILLCSEKVTSEDSCVKSWQFMKCYYDTDSSITFFP